MRSRALLTAAPAAVIAVVAAVTLGATSPSHAASARPFGLELISRAIGGGMPNAPSTNPVISDDKRFARVITFESAATNLVHATTGGQTNVYMVRRGGKDDGTGNWWTPGRTSLISRTDSGAAPNGPSYNPTVDGAFHRVPSCIAFLSQASNLVAGDTNGKADAFVSRGPGGPPTRVSLLPGNRQASDDTTAVAVSGDCTRIAFVTGGRLYVRIGHHTRAIHAPGVAGNPSFSTGLRDDLVFDAARGVYLSFDATRSPRLVAPGGRNPAYNDIGRQVVAYEKPRAGHMQIFFHDLGKPEQLVSDYHGRLGDGDSTNPVIGNAGFYITFQSEAQNIGEGGPRQRALPHGHPGTYLYTDVRKLTLCESAFPTGDPIAGGGANPSMSFYANYIVFDTPAPAGSTDGTRQVYLRWLGPE